MLDALNTALTGLNAANTRLNVTANNIANLNSDHFTPQRPNFSNAPNSNGVQLDSTTDLPTSEPDHLASDLVDLQTSHTLYTANAAVVRASDHMLGTLLDVLDHHPDNAHHNP